MADTKISDLAAVTTPAGTDEFAVNQGGTSKKVTLSKFWGLPLGLIGATAATRYVGATASGAPVSGTFAVGDFVIDQAGGIYICTVAGTPGTWTAAGGGGGGSPADVAASLITAYSLFR